MSAHTPGPWIFTDEANDPCCWAFHVQSTAPDPDGIADVLTEANARLIAAAPDLLAALEMFVLDAGRISELSGSLKRACAAIAKATGAQA